MHIITVSRFRPFEAIYPNAVAPLKRWELIIRHAEYANFAQLQLDFPDADLVGELTVFNIGGNKFRLVVYINFQGQVVFIKEILTHDEYMTNKWKK